MHKCEFCKIASHKKPSKIVFEDKRILAFMDSDPISDGHVLIIPKKHIIDLHSLDSKNGQRIMEVAKKISMVIQKTFQYDGTMIMEVNGKFQDVPHFHLHVFGRSKKDDVRFTWPKKTDCSAEKVEKNFKKITSNLVANN